MANKSLGKPTLAIANSGTGVERSPVGFLPPCIPACRREGLKSEVPSARNPIHIRIQINDIPQLPMWISLTHAVILRITKNGRSAIVMFRMPL